MGAHVHDPMQDDAIERWNADRMARHLREVHGMTLPMSWDLGRMHQFHLQDHQSGMKRPTLNIPSAPPPPRTECEAYYGVGDGTSAICRRPVNHPEVSEDGIGHSPQPIPIQPTAEEAPMPQTIHEHGDIADWHDRTPTQFVREHVAHDHGITVEEGESLYGRHAQAHPMPKEVVNQDEAEEQVEDDAARGLWMKEKGRPASSWTTQTWETREHFRRKVRQQKIGYGAASAEHADRQEDRRVTVDRIICTLAGLDFDRDWAADSGIGPNVRGSVRKAFIAQAEKMLFWLERGGAMTLPGYASLGTDLERERSLIVDLEEINNRLRGREVQLEAEVRGLQDTLEEVRDERDSLQQQLVRLTAERDGLDRQLQTALSLKDMAVEQLATDQREYGKSLDAVQRQLEGAQRSYESMKARRDEALEVLGETATERDELRTRAMNAEDEIRRLRAERDAVSTVTEASQGTDDAELAAINARVEAAAAANRATRNGLGEDANLIWARWFAAGGDA